MFKVAMAMTLSQATAVTTSAWGKPAMVDSTAEFATAHYWSGVVSLDCTFTET